MKNARILPLACLLLAAPALAQVAIPDAPYDGPYVESVESAEVEVEEEAAPGSETGREPPEVGSSREHVARLSRALMRADLKVQAEAAQAIRETAAEIRAAADPAGLRSAYGELVGALAVMVGGISERSPEENQRIVALLEKLDRRITALAAPEEADRILEKGADAKGALSDVRSALAIHYGDTEGGYPADLQGLVPKYLDKVPVLLLPGHSPTNGVRVLSKVKDQKDLDSQLKDSGGWLYVADKESPLFGTLLVDCTHKDARGVRWHER